MFLGYALLGLGQGHPLHRGAALDAFAAARTIAVKEIANVRRGMPHARFRLLDSGGELSRADLMSLRASLLLPGPPPRNAPRVVTLDFGAVRRLPKGRLAMDVSVRFGPQGGAAANYPPDGVLAHYVVNPSKTPDDAVERRSVGH